MSVEPERWYAGVRFTQRWLWPRGQWEYKRDRAQEVARTLWPHADALAVVNQATGERWQWNSSTGWTKHEQAPPAPKVLERGPRMWWIEDE